MKVAHKIVLMPMGATFTIAPLLPDAWVLVLGKTF